MKRLLAGILVFIMLLAIIAPVIAETSYDEAAKVLNDLDVLKGDENGNLMLNKNFKRQDMVVMISRLYKKEDVAKTFTGKNVFKDLTSERKFYIPYITWAKEEGLIIGREKDEFGFNEEVTVQELQTVLLRALGYGDEASNWNNVPALAEKMGIMEGLDIKPSAKISRGQLSVMVLNTLRENKKSLSLSLGEILGLKIPLAFKVDAKATIDLNTVTFKGSVSGVDSLKLHLRPTSSGISGGVKLLDIKLDKEGNFNHIVKDLEAGNYEYRFESDKKNSSFKSLEIKQVPFKLTDIKADNLKEISLSFTQPVETSSALFVNNYSTSAGTIKEVRFEDNNKKVILVLNGVMAQQSKHKVSIHRMKSLNGDNLTIDNEEFSAFDNEVPKIVDIVQLGNKGLKVVFSEPIKGASYNNFQIDRRNLMGNVKLDNNVAILTYHSSSYAPSEGSHTLTVTGIEDFAGYKAVDEDLKFTIIKDTTAPSVVDQNATLENVVLEFDEDIDPASANKNNFYWKSGNSKRYPDSVKFIDNKAYLEFRNNTLSSNENIIYIENVSDYSGNKIRLTEVKVTPVIDKTSPEVVNYKVSDDGRAITVYYSKNVNGKNKSDYFIEDDKGKTIYIRDVQGSGREFTIQLSTTLPIGSNRLIIEGVRDTTPLRNELIPFSTDINMKDIEKPKIIGSTGYGNYIMIQFSKEMDISTVTNQDNYYINFNNSISRLPSESLITPGNDGESVTITLPENINGKKVQIGSNLTSMEIRGLTDTSGNDTDPLLVKIDLKDNNSGQAQAVDYYSSKPGKQGVLVEEDVIKVRFNIPIVYAEARDFYIRGREVEKVVTDGSNEVTLYLNRSDNTSILEDKLTIESRNNIKTSIDTNVKAGTIYLVDEVAPRVKDNSYYLENSGNIIELPFTEALESIGEKLYARDLKITRLEDGKVLSESEYNTSLYSKDNSILQIQITKPSISSAYSVEILKPQYIRDVQGNLLSDSSSGIYYETSKIIR